MNTRKMQKFSSIFFAALLGIGFFLDVFVPKETYSDTERRPLQSRPVPTFATVLSGTYMHNFENYAVDTFPFRDTFRFLKAAGAHIIFGKLDNNGLYCHDGYLVKTEYPLNEESLEHARERINYIIRKFHTPDTDFYMSIIPDKNRYFAKDSGHLQIKYERLAQILTQDCEAEYIDIYPLLEGVNYYRTDSHWKEETLLPVAEMLLKKMHVYRETGYTKKIFTDDFHGVYHGQAALPLPGESIYYLTNEQIENAQVFDRQNNRRIRVYNPNPGKDAYDFFLGGALSLVQIRNTHADSDRNLIIFRDSFASSIAPLLLNSYKEITLVDIRYMHPDRLETEIDFRNSDVLFLYSTSVLNHSETLK